MKKCINCDKEESSRWHKGPVCGSCYYYTNKERYDRYRQNHKEKQSEYYQELKKKNPNYSAECYQKQKDKNPTYYQDNKIKFADYYQENKEKIKRRVQEYQKNNKDKINLRNSKKRRLDDEFKLRQNLRSRLNMAMRSNSKSGSAVKDLGCSIPDLKSHLESKFSYGMSWDNYGSSKESWVIDHILPLSSFDLSNRNELLVACNFINLQPLWYIDNAVKGNKVDVISSSLEKEGIEINENR